jgi:tripartite-type tricarboxylate transporter receptor subunit TctC
MKPTSLSISRRSALVALAPLLAPAAFAQSNQITRMLLSVSPGSGLDNAARGTEQPLSSALGRQISVENLPGAGGLIGTNTLLRATPDGSTISMVSANHVIFPLVLKSAHFHPVNDFTMIAIAGNGTMVFVVNSKVPAKDARELAALLKANPERYNYASSGMGTILHLGFELFLDEAGVRAKHIPYKGGSSMVTDLITGRCDMAVLAMAQALPHLKSGALRAVGVSAEQRSALMPDLPTLAEQGFPRTMVDAWFAVIGPKGIPAAEVARINAALVKAFNSPEAQKVFGTIGATIKVSSPEYAQKFMAAEFSKFGSLVKTIGLEPQ